MRTIVAAALLCLVIALMLPLLFAGGGQAAPEASAEPESAAGGLDSELSFTVLTADGVETVTMSDWLPGVVAGEMPALFEEEALKAQAVAARTYIMYSMGRESPRTRRPTSATTRPAARRTRRTRSCARSGARATRRTWPACWRPCAPRTGST